MRSGGKGSPRLIDGLHGERRRLQLKHEVWPHNGEQRLVWSCSRLTRWLSGSLALGAWHKTTPILFIEGQRSSPILMGQERLNNRKTRLVNSASAEIWMFDGHVMVLMLMNSMEWTDGGVWQNYP